MKEPKVFLRLKFEELFGIDLRSMALFRIAIALVLLYDLITRAVDLTVFYTDSGAFSRFFLLTQMNNPFAISLHLINGTTPAQIILFLLQGAFAIGLLLGFRTRLMTFWSWFFLISLQDRNPLVTMGSADTYLRLLLFWSLFLPLGKYFSLDATRHHQHEERSLSHFSWGTTAILLQCAIVYLMTGALKWNDDIWHNGTALNSILSNDIFAKPMAGFLLRFPGFVGFLNYGVLWFEYLGTILLFFPFGTGPVRTFAVFGFMFMHLVFYLCMSVEIFQLVSVTAILLFLPSWFWNHCVPKSLHQTFAKINPINWVGNIRSSQVNNVSTLFAGRLKPALLADMYVIIFLGCTLLWNIENFPGSGYRMPQAVKVLSRSAHLDQYWGMFVKPLAPPGWFVVAGKLKGGAQIDLLRKGALLSWEKPRRVWANYRTERWRKYLFRLLGKREAALEYARYLCRSWNASHDNGKQLESLEIVYMRKPIPPNEKPELYGKDVLLRYNCTTKKQNIPLEKK